MKASTEFDPTHSLRVGILTLHYGYNEGALLQAMCLARAVGSLGPDVSAEIVDHRYPGKAAKYGPARNARTQALQRYVDHQLPLSPERFASDRIGPTLRYASARYTNLLIGSDQVLRLRYSKRIRGLARLQTDAFHPAFPNIYWAAARCTLKCSAYAASMGPFTVSDAPRSHQRRMARLLTAFDRLGVRDTNTEEQVRALPGSDLTP